MARKNFVLDTNVLLHDPRSIYSFDDNTVIIPIYVIEELDMFKKDMSELGRNARQVARYLDAHRAEGTLAEGVPLPNGGLLRVSFVEHDLPKSMADGQLMDNRILAVAIETRMRDPTAPTVFITKDTNLRIRADALGPLGPGLRARAGRDQRSLLRHRRAAGAGRAHQPALPSRAPRSLVSDLEALVPNQFVLLKDAANPSHTGMGRFDAAKQVRGAA